MRLHRVRGSAPPRRAADEGVAVASETRALPLRPMRAVLDVTPLIGRPTGVGVFTGGLVRALATAAGVELAAYTLTRRSRSTVKAALQAADVRLPLPALPMLAGPLLRAWSRQLPAQGWPPGDWWVGRADVVHGTNFTVPPMRRAATLVTVHDLAPMRFPELCSATALQYPDLVRAAVRRGSHVHTPSRAMAEEVVELLGAPEERVHVIGPGVAPVLAAAEGSARPFDGKPFILALGTVEPRKDLPLLVRSFAGLAQDQPDLLLVIAGADGAGAPALDRAIAALDPSVRARVRRLGYVHEGRRAELLRSASVLAYPSVYEGFGLPPLEAMSVGVPVVATAAGAVPEVVGDAALLTPPGDADALTDALRQVSTDETVRVRLVAAGRLRVAPQTWERSSAMFVDLYLRLAPRSISKKTSTTPTGTTISGRRPT